MIRRSVRVGVRPGLRGRALTQTGNIVELMMDVIRNTFPAAVPVP